MLIVLLPLLVPLAQVHANPDKSGTCDATLADLPGNMPLQERTEQRGVNSGFSLSMDGGSFKVGATNTIRVKRKSGTTGFRGLLLYVEDSSNTRIGTMSTTSATQLLGNCPGGASATLTHSSSSAGDTTFSADETFTWTAPVTVNGPITIYAIVYETGAKIFHVPSPETVNVMATTTTTTPPPIDCLKFICPALPCARKDRIPPPPGQCCPSCPSCPPNFVFRSCATCNSTCSRLGQPSLCPAICFPASCNCFPPFALDKNGNCIPANSCPTTPPPTKPCPPNFEFRRCSTCNSTCNNPNPICTRECKPAGCNCVPPNALDGKGNCIRAYRCNNCRRLSKIQETKGLTRYSSCIPATIDVGTCIGKCHSPASSRFCPICDVAAYATQRIRCRNFVGAQVSVSIDIVKSCGCRDVPSVSTGILTRKSSTP